MLQQEGQQPAIAPIRHQNIWVISRKRGVDGVQVAALCVQRQSLAKAVRAQVERLHCAVGRVYVGRKFQNAQGWQRGHHIPAAVERLQGLDAVLAVGFQLAQRQRKGAIARDVTRANGYICVVPNQGGELVFQPMEKLHLVGRCIHIDSQHVNRIRYKDVLLLLAGELGDGWLFAQRLP